MAYRKTNNKGEKAPNGYHYMSDDSLMSDEEHERVYGRPLPILRPVLLGVIARCIVREKVFRLIILMYIQTLQIVLLV